MEYMKFDHIKKAFNITQLTLSAFQCNKNNIGS